VYDHIREPVEYKRATDAAMISYAKRWGVPSIVGFYAPGQDKSAQAKFLAAIKSLQNAAAATLPIKPTKDSPDVLQLIEAKGDGGSISAVMDMNKAFEKRIAGAVLGSILAVYESEYGTRAQAQTHLEVLKSVIEAAQAPLEEAINEQLVQPVLAYNRGLRDVRFVLNAPNLNDLEKLGNMVADLAQAGLLDPAQDARVIRTMFGIDTPEGWAPPGAPNVGDVAPGSPDLVPGEQRWTVGR
jgi:phage gp29-like protein